ncbi:hypothetical protein BKA81DRAFT_153628 [Phyllosticta paracitricarpa]
MPADWKEMNRVLDKQLRIVENEIEHDQKKLSAIKAKAAEVAKMMGEVKDNKANLERQREMDIACTHHDNDHLGNYTYLCEAKKEQERHKSYIRFHLLQDFPKSAELLRELYDEIRKSWNNGKPGCPLDLFAETIKMLADCDNTAKAAGFGLDCGVGPK